MKSTSDTIHIIIGLLLAFQFNTACSQMTYEEKLAQLYQKSVPLIHPSEVADLKGAHRLDTRTYEEYSVSHLPNAQFIDYDAFNISQVSDIPKDAEIVVYCSVGYRSERIGEQLLESGFINVKNMYGGIFQWKNDGFQVMDANNQPTDSVHTYNKNWSKWLTKGVKVYD